MNGELGLAGIGPGQVFCSAGIHARVVRTGVEDDEGIFWVIIDKRVMAALRKLNVILQTNPQSHFQSRSCAALPEKKIPIA